MNLTRGTVVISLTGRDKDRYLAVISVEDGYVNVANGELRKIETPKKKNIKHVSTTNTVFEEEILVSNRSLNKAIKERFGAERR